jgi:hypothetical protein
VPTNTDRLDQYLEAWRHDLIDLTRRNRLINLLTSGRGNVLEIREPDYSAVISRLDASGARGWRFHYPPIKNGELDDDPNLLGALAAEDPDLTAELSDDELLTNVATAALLSTRLRALASKANSEFVDRGLRVLYLVVGLLKWNDGDPKGLMSPLVLIPVHLDRASPREPYRLVDAEEDWVSNPALAAKLREEFDVTLPDFDSDDIAGYLKSVAKEVRPLGWTVEDFCGLATLSFVKETIYRDLIDNEDEIKSSDVIRAMTLGGEDRRELEFEPINPASEKLDLDFPPEVLSSVLDADGTQRSCIVAAKQGETFVMDGPPGSGKSQTITNIIAELLADGKTVLFVSEKVAALEVVKKRLDESRLGEFILELHSHKATRKAVAAELGKAIRRNLQLPRVRHMNDRQLRERREELSLYAQAINESRYLAPHIRNLHDAIGRCGQLDHLVHIPSPTGFGRSLTADTFDFVLSLGRQLANSWGPVERGEDFLWRDLAPGALEIPQHQINSDLAEAERLGDDFLLRLKRFSEQLDIQTPTSLSGARNLVKLSQLLERRPQSIAHLFNLTDIHVLLAEVLSLRSQFERSQHLHRMLESDDLDVNSLILDPGTLPEAIKRVRLYVPESASLEEVKTRAHSSREMALLSTSLVDSIEKCADLLGLKLRDRSIKTAQTLLEVINLGSLEHRPVDKWLDQMMIKRVQLTIRVVAPLLEEWRSLEKQIMTHFNDNIRSVEISAFYDSAIDVQPKLGRVGGRGRQNRKQLQACIIGGKITKESIALLPVVRSWRNLTSRLDGLDEGAVLGSYFAGPATDLTAVEAAVQVALRAFQLVGESPDLTRLGGVIACDSVFDPIVLAIRDELQSCKKEWQDGISIGRLVLETTPEQDLSGIADLLKGVADDFDEVADEMSPYCRTDQSTIADATKSYETCAELAVLQKRVVNFSRAGDLGAFYQGLNTEWQTLIDALQWVIDAQSCLPAVCSSPTVESLCEIPRDTEIEDSFGSFDRAITNVCDLFEAQYRDDIRKVLNHNLGEMLELLSALRQSSGDIEEWRVFAQTIVELRERGLDEIASSMLSQRVPADQIEQVLERTVLTGWVDETLRADPRTRKSRRQDRDEVLQGFRDLDRQLHLEAVARVIQVCNEKRPTAVSGEFQIIEREGAKKTKHMPVRDLLMKASNAALDLKPCFMMSPLSVSQFLPPQLKFDCVVFDEASQVKPADAVNAIYRGRQVIIAGDERQLPPTSFFDRGVQDDDVYDEEEVDEFESILSLAKAGVMQLPLRWHYRSRHESLISFSNREYYDSELITFPGAIEYSDELGIHFEHVPEGVYARGGSKDNVIEARRVVERVIHHATTRPDRSLGVIAFSDAQASRISVELDAVRRQRPDLDDFFAQDRLDGFFVKNLESVQGDERDVIIFSIGYGRDEFGKFTMNFGPVGREGGERRLNVAATRARERVEVVASVTAGDFQETTNVRVQSLKRYLDYAERGIVAFADQGVTGQEPDSPFEEDVIRVVRELGYEPRPQVGQAGFRIDIGVVHPEKPGRFVLGIECDGATYHSSRVARDRDRLRQEILEGLGWNIYRIWSTSWFRDRNAEIERLREVLQSATSKQAMLFTPRQRRTIPEPEVFELEQVVAPWATEYSEDGLAKIRSIRSFGELVSSEELQNMLLRIVEVLQPAHLEKIEYAVKEIQGFSTLSANRKEAIGTELRSLVRRREFVKDRYGFFWRGGEQEVVVRRGDPAKPETVRKAVHVSPDEAKLAMFWLTRDGRSVEKDQLKLDAARLFGWLRSGPEVQALLDKAFNELVEKGDLTQLSDGRWTVEDREFPDLS